MTAERQVLRPLQASCLEQAKSANIIICLPTNEGKTLIAARLIEHYLHKSPEKRAVFLVPTQALVDQQAKTCAEQIRLDGIHPTPRVLKIVGNDQAGWESHQWKKAYEDHHLFVGTPAVFEEAIVKAGYLSIAGFSVVVFDECHNAKGDHAMARVMRDGIHPYINKSGTGLPRVLGLTASFANGKTSNLEKDRRDLELLLHATILCPEVEERLKLENFIRVSYNDSDKYHTKQHKATIEQHLRCSLQKLGRFKDIKKALKRCSDVFSQLGRDALHFYVEHVVQQIEDRIESLELMEDENTRKAAEGLRRAMPLLRQEVKALSERLSEVVAYDTAVPRVTNKLQCLLDLLLQNFRKQDGRYSGIVFVEQVCVVTPMAKIINDSLQQEGVAVQCGVVAGSSAQARSDRSDNLDAFKSGELRILVATSACEEGLDVPQCQFSAMYDEVLTAKSHIQRAGRVRHHSAEIYYFENDPACELRRAARVHQVARDTSLSTSFEERQKENASICTSDTSKKHPYPPDSENNEGLVTVLNAKAILVQYCCGVLMETINPARSLYFFMKVDGHQRDALVSVRYPTPESWQTVEKKEVDDFWHGEDLTEIFCRSKTRRKSNFGREERLFAYIIAVKLRRAGLLDRHNKPTANAQLRTKLACPLENRQSTVRFALKQKVSLPQSAEKGNVDVKMETDPGSSIITLEDSPQILRRYIAVVFDDDHRRVFEEELFDRVFERDARGQAKGPVPNTLRFPTPMGWSEVTLADYKEKFEGMDLDDQLGTEKYWSPCQKAELAFMYLAVMRLHDCNFLDQDYKPSLTPAALRTTRQQCPVDSVAGGGSPASVRSFPLSYVGTVDNTMASDFSFNSIPNNQHSAPKHVGLHPPASPTDNGNSIPRVGTSAGPTIAGREMSMASSRVSNSIDDGSSMQYETENNNALSGIPHVGTLVGTSSDDGREMSMATNSFDEARELESTMQYETESSNDLLDRFADHDEPSSPQDMISTSISRGSGMQDLDDDEDDRMSSASVQRSGVQENANDGEVIRTSGISSNSVFEDAEAARQEGPVFSSLGGQFDDADDEFSL